MSALLAIKLAHLFGFLGCLGASANKNLLLRKDAIAGRDLGWLLMLDRISGLSTVVILATGLAMAGWFAKPTAYYVGSVVFWFKIGLFTLASLAVLTTKPLLRKAKAAGALRPAARERWLLRFDLGAIIVIAALGRWIATTLGR